VLVVTSREPLSSRSGERLLARVSWTSCSRLGPEASTITICRFGSCRTTRAPIRVMRLIVSDDNTPLHRTTTRRDVLGAFRTAVARSGATFPLPSSPVARLVTWLVVCWTVEVRPPVRLPTNP
jgi:hypothetical protein